jgi:hypothetical protein
MNGDISTDAPTEQSSSNWWTPSIHGRYLTVSFGKITNECPLPSFWLSCSVRLWKWMDKILVLTEQSSLNWWMKDDIWQYLW